MMPRKSPGISKVPIQNAFVRTRSKYSRRTTAMTFFQFIGASLDDAGLFDPGVLDGAQIDLLELRFLAVEGFDGVLFERPLQEFALVGPRLEGKDEAAVDGLGGYDAGEARELAEARVDRDADLVLREPALQVPHAAFQDLLRARHEADLVAELLGLLEDVRREDDRLA